MRLIRHLADTTREHLGIVFFSANFCMALVLFVAYELVPQFVNGWIVPLGILATGVWGVTCIACLWGLVRSLCLTPRAPHVRMVIILICALALLPASVNITRFHLGFFAWKPLLYDVVQFVQAHQLASGHPEYVHLPKALRAASSGGEIYVINTGEVLKVRFYRLRIWGPEDIQYVFSTVPISYELCHLIEQDAGFWYVCGS